MDRIKIFSRFDDPLHFSVTTIDKEARLYISLVDNIADDVLFHVEFNKQAGQVLVKDRYSGAWSKPVFHDFQFRGQFVTGTISLEGENFVLSLKNFRLEFPCKGLQTPIVWSVYSDFRYITIGDNEPVTTALARRWRFFPDHQKLTGTGSKLRALEDSSNRKSGLTSLYLWDGDQEALRNIVSKSWPVFDEILIIIHNTSINKYNFFISLQSIYFNIRTVIVETTIKSDGELWKLEGALFMNKVLSEINYRNVLFLNPDTDTAEIEPFVRRHQLRTRDNDFAILNETNNYLQAFSLTNNTYFIDQDDGHIRLPSENLAYRHVVLANGPAPSACLEWNVAGCQVAEHPVIAVDRQKKTGTPRRGNLVIFVISCRKNRHKQQAIRETWAKDARDANIDLCFVEGHPEYSEPLLVDDRLFVPSPDTYEYLSHKIWYMAAAGIRLFDADHYLKLDDDCVLNVQKLLELSYEDYDYLGSDINLGSRTAFDWHHVAVANKQLSELIFEVDPQHTWFDGQGGYFLSRKAAALIAETPLLEYQHMLEDYATGRLLGAKGLPAGMLNSKFLSIREIYIQDDRDYDNAVISDVTSVERTLEIHEIISKRNQQILQSKGRWRFEFPDEQTGEKDR